MAEVFLTGTQNQGTDQPAAPTLTPIPTPDGTLQGMENIVQALTQNARALSGQLPAYSNSNSKKNATAGRWVELSRQTKEVTITDQDSGASVTFEQITQLVMQDTVTKEKWTWNL